MGAVLFSICIVQLGVNEYNSKFQTDRWLKDERKRVYMIDDLLTKHKLVGKPKKEIVQLLGKPTETRRFEEMNQTDEGIRTGCFLFFFNMLQKGIVYSLWNKE